jgi:predicted nucleic acid-binding protein
MSGTYFPDSSVLVKRHVNEIGSYWFSNLADAKTGNTIIISRLSLNEVISAFNRRCRELSLTQTEYQKVSQALKVLL